MKTLIYVVILLCGSAVAFDGQGCDGQNGQPCGKSGGHVICCKA